MKYSTAVLLATSLLGSASGEQLEKRQFPGMPINALGPISAAMGIGGKVSESGMGGKIARKVQELKATNFQSYGSRRVKIRYGPYSVPGSKRGAIGKMMDGEGGMMWNMPDKNIEKPCTDCLIHYMRAGLEDAAGNDLNSDVGLWLHHMVAINKGSGLKDATCASHPVSLPHMDVAASSRNSERFFASGNERTPIDMRKVDGKYGYQVKSGDQMSYIIELMNMNADSKKVYMTLTWEYVPGAPAGFGHAKPIWYDVFQCGLSDVKPKKENGKFTYSAKTWRSTISGKMLGVGTHLHDGGVSVDIIQNGRVICNSKAGYGETPKYISSMAMEGKSGGKQKMTAGSNAIMHISSQSACYNKEGLGKINQGDKMDMIGYYDYDKHPGMPKNNGKQSDIMVIGIMYVGVPMGQR